MFFSRIQHIGFSVLFLWVSALIGAERNEIVDKLLNSSSQETV